MNATLNSWLSEPRVENPPRFVWRDWALVAIFITTLVLEVILRDDINAKVIAIPWVAIMVLSLPFRRTHPLEVGAGVLGGMIVFDIVSVIAGYGPLDVYTGALLLIIVYAVFRWGSGRDMAIVSALAFALFVLSTIFDYTGVADAFSGCVILLLPVAAALAVRFLLRSRQQAREQIRITERERLARDLHDTVAHHMSAIAIQAQAGRFVAESGSLEGATQALEVIEEEASRTLAEMRSIVEVLRDNDAIEMAPQHGIGDLEGLASSAGPPLVRVAIDDGARRVGPAVGAALFRIAQESVTNARRHAHDPSTIDVRVAALPGHVQLTVTDDGGSAAAPSTQGFGLIGMTERATLLGGTLDAGPAPRNGWQVIATLPTES